MDKSRPNYNVQPEALATAKAKFNKMTDKQKKELESSMSWFFLTDNIKKKTRLQIQANMKRMDLFSLIFAAIGLATQIASSNCYIGFSKTQNGSKI